MIFHIFNCILYHLRVYYELTKWPALSWLGYLGSVLYWYRIGNGFESRVGLNFLQV